MKIVKIGKRYQITIPKEISNKLHLEEGDLLEAEQEGGKIVLVPKRLVDKAPVPRLSEKEQELLAGAREKMARIQKDISNSRGLTTAEVKVAVKTGLIDPDQAYWWHEDWQKGERKAEENMKAKKPEGPFDDAEDLLKSLKSR